MRKYLLLVWLLCLTATFALAQETKPMSWKDVATWKYMPTVPSNSLLTDSGCLCLIGIEADGELILQKVSDPESKKNLSNRKHHVSKFRIQ